MRASRSPFASLFHVVAAACVVTGVMGADGDACVIRIIVEGEEGESEGEEGEGEEGEGEGEVVDSDGDGLNDDEEGACFFAEEGGERANDAEDRVAPVGWCTDPHNADSDFDGLSDGDEVLKLGTDPLNPDSDFDGLLDGEDPDPWTPNGGNDSDFDGVDDETERALGLDPFNADSDGDGLLDGQELCAFINEPQPEPARDDDDGCDPSDPSEPEPMPEPLPWSCTDPLLFDTDGDGLSDSDELWWSGTDPLNPDTDGDGVLDGEESIALPGCDDGSADCG